VNVRLISTSSSDFNVFRSV